MSSSAQEYHRCPLAPVPALTRRQARRGSDRASSSTRWVPVVVVTVRLDPTAYT
jgi:hypothetical protein